FRSKGGKFVLRIKDTNLERSTKKYKEAMLQYLTWFSPDWDEGPGVGGEFGPFRQLEQNDLYKQYAEKLLNSGDVYRCFCSNEELEKMKEIAKLKQLPPVYTGKWAIATERPVQEELEKGTPYTYRFQVPKEDCVNLLFAYLLHFREEEHLPNNLRQALIYKALGFSMPYFAHVSLILALDRSKLSKRHGATSVGPFSEMGYLPQAMVNYLALLGWGDGTENEFFTIEQLVENFSIHRVNKSGVIFDSTKLRWMNGQHLRVLPSDENGNLEEPLVPICFDILRFRLTRPTQAKTQSDSGDRVTEKEMADNGGISPAGFSFNLAVMDCSYGCKSACGMGILGGGFERRRKRLGGSCSLVAGFLPKALASENQMAAKITLQGTVEMEGCKGTLPIFETLCL
ncbi:glutamate--tRNA ligase, chloroplastic/mitochondrial-like, partial [Magnolia sinica]|uniref:glutamate--tRNA ligase, chloroplastic/mitochondrial-like n=1 Tax=Magnolia sinica TaxID=86752 RepID=UPI002659AB3A